MRPLFWALVLFVIGVEIEWIASSIFYDSYQASGSWSPYPFDLAIVAFGLLVFSFPIGLIAEFFGRMRRRGQPDTRTDTPSGVAVESPASFSLDREADPVGTFEDALGRMKDRS